MAMKNGMTFLPVLLGFLCAPVHGYEVGTHMAISEKAVTRSMNLLLNLENAGLSSLEEAPTV